MQTIKLGHNEMVVNKSVFNDMLIVKKEIDSIIETLEIMNNPDLMNGIERSKRDVKEGRTHELKSIDDLDKVWEQNDES
ncbi:hypothetical protein MSIBF_A3640004 [groundwater metagenome]|uniref:Antitoxin n=1 Tax=groundwater metagenome TaxID=717931 RepID=A0A098EBC0_9ZZZZ